MQKQKNSLSQQLEPVRSEILNSYLTTIKDSFRENRPQLKLINYGTGSGKTHQLFQAIYKTIRPPARIKKYVPVRSSANQQLD
jgi:hypothetical protein